MDDIYRADSLISSFYEFDIIPRECDYKPSFNVSHRTFVDRLRIVKQNRKQLSKIQKRKQIKQRSSEWYETRKNMLTASQTMEYVRKTPSIIKQKQDRTANEFTSPATSWGNMFEPLAKQLYCELKHIHLSEVGFLIDDKLKFYGASPDGVTPNGTLVEFKCPKSRPIIKDTIPDRYMAQMQGQMAVCQLSECDYCEFGFKVIPEDEYLNLENTYCGVIVHEEEKNMYTHCCDIPYRSYLKTMQYNNKTFWKLDDYQIKRVYFDNKRWKSFYQKKITDFWKLVNPGNV